MNKTELIEHIAKHADISKAAATRALESMIGAVKYHAEEGRLGFAGGFRHFRGRQAGRPQRPQSAHRRAIKIKAAKVPKFRPGKALKDALN